MRRTTSPRTGTRQARPAPLRPTLAFVAMAVLVAACSSTTGSSSTGGTGGTGAPPGARSDDATGTTILGSTSTAPPTTPPPTSSYAWTQLGPDGQTVVRTLSDGDCPTAQAGSQPLPMTEFAPPSPPAFPQRTCQAVVPPNATSVDVGGQRVPGTPQKLDRVVVVGDIGCYVKAEKQQDCNDPSKFPAKAVGDQIAAADPDLVVFVGDIYYSQAECPDPTKCSGVPFGDQWTTWAYDFFDPYRNALDAAPWIFARGNHERCSGKDDDGGPGWFQLLAPTFGPCQDITDPFLISLFDQRFVVFDTALADDAPADPAQVAEYVPKVQQVAALTAGQRNVWFVSHRPTWAGKPEKDGTTMLNQTLQQANQQAGSPLNTDIDLFLAGHMHALGVFGFADGRAGQLVSGGGGTELEKRSGDMTGQSIDGTTFSFGRVEPEFGYFVLDRAGATASWNITAVELGGAVWTTCTLEQRTLTCGS